MESQITQVMNMLREIPKEDKPENEAYFWMVVANELSILIRTASVCEKPKIVLNQWRKAGEQYIWEFYVNDLAKTERETYNRHLQNTSQWVYAGCILLDHGQVSTHH